LATYKSLAFIAAAVGGEDADSGAGVEATSAPRQEARRSPTTSGTTKEKRFIYAL
jgi:hypothetical protein